MKKIYRAAILLAAAALLAATARIQYKDQELKRFEGSFFGSFDTITSITGYAKDQKEFSGQLELLEQKLQHYHELFDIYHTYEGINNIKTINDAAGTEPVKVDEDIIELLKLGKEMYQKTGGQINIASGSVLTVWHEYREQGTSEPENAKLPPEDLLKERAEHMDMDKLVIDEKASTVYLEDPKMSLDVGSIGKGYAVQRLSEYAKEIGMEHVLISVGGNVCAVGSKADGTPWRVGIENPDLTSEQSYVRTVDISDASIVTSGNYQRYYEVDGKRYCHIIDPDTGMPAEHFPSVSVITSDSGMADALSTALFNMEFEEGLSFVESLPDVEALWVLEDGGIRCSEGFKVNEEE